LLSVAVIAFFIVYQKRLFAQQGKIVSMETAYQKDLLNASIEVQEAERKRIATDLHDGIGSQLSAIRLYMHQFKPETPIEVYKELKEESIQMIDSSIEQIRKITYNLLPSSLDRFGILQALEDLCKRIEKLNGLEINFDYNEAYQFTKQQDLALYRIFQELINNTLKHAQASQVNIQFHSSSTQVNISYQDNGKGLPKTTETKSKFGLGMKSIESRVNFINGKMSIQSSKNNGFQFGLILSKA
jgi:signal transduction histidine kinase